MITIEIPVETMEHVRGALQVQLDAVEDMIHWNELEIAKLKTPEWLKAEAKIRAIEKETEPWRSEVASLRVALALMPTGQRALPAPKIEPKREPIEAVVVECPMPAVSIPSTTNEKAKMDIPAVQAPRPSHIIAPPPPIKEPRSPSNGSGTAPSLQLTLDALHAAVPREKWIGIDELCAKLKSNPDAVQELMRDPKCGVWIPHPRRVAWRPPASVPEKRGPGRPPKAQFERTQYPAAVKVPVKLPPKPDPTFQKPPRINGFPSEGKSDPKEFDVPPMHQRAVEIGHTLINPWTATDLMARINGDMGRAQQWIISWLEIEWIEPGGFGQYRKTEAFGLGREEAP